MGTQRTHPSIVQRQLVGLNPTQTSLFLNTAWTAVSPPLHNFARVDENIVLGKNESIRWARVNDQRVLRLLLNSEDIELAALSSANIGIAEHGIAAGADTAETYVTVMSSVERLDDDSPDWTDPATIIMPTLDEKGVVLTAGWGNKRAQEVPLCDTNNGVLCSKPPNDGNDPVLIVAGQALRAKNCRKGSFDQNRPGKTIIALPSVPGEKGGNSCLLATDACMESSGRSRILNC